MILEILRVRIDNPTDEELETGGRELVAIAMDRWERRDAAILDPYLTTGSTS